MTKIGTDAFFNCSRLTQIFLPESVTSIGNYAFERCTNLTSIKIPDNVENIGSGAFGYCTNLMRFEGKFASEDGKLLIIPDNYYGSVLRAFADPQATSVNISEDGISVGYVDMYVFAGHQNLKSVYCTCDYSSCAFNDSSVENFTLSYWSIDPLEFSEYNCKTLTLLDNDNNQYLSLGWPRYLESITLPEDITIFGDFGPNGSSLPTGCKIYGSHASIDHTCWIVDGDLQLFAFPEDTHFYKLPSSITKVSCIISSHKEDEGPLNYFYLNYETGDDISLSTQIGVVIPDSVSSILSPYCMRIPVFMESSTPPGVNEPIFGNTGMEFPIAIVVPYNSCDDYMNSWNAYPDNPDSWTPIFIFTYSELPNNSDTYFSDTIRTY